MQFKLFDAIKLGFGFYIGHEMARVLDGNLGEIFSQLQNRIQN